MTLPLCACMGPTGDDPFCPCVMKQKGLEPTPLWTSEKIEELRNALAKYSPEPVNNNKESKND